MKNACAQPFFFILAGKELSWLGTIFSDSVQYKTTSWHQCFILLFQVFVLFFIFTAFVSLLMHVNRFTTNHLINCKRVILGQIFIFNCCKCLSYTQNCKSKCLLFSHKGQVKSFVLSFCMLSVVASWSKIDFKGILCFLSFLTSFFACPNVR